MSHPKPTTGVAGANLAPLVYELLDAHDDTARLAADFALDTAWQAHLEYLRHLQRYGREALAHAAARHRADG